VVKKADIKPAARLSSLEGKTIVCAGTANTTATISCNA
jgi:hypothetical protein